VSTAVAADRAATDATTEFLVRFARAGQAAGYSTTELEQRVEALAPALGMPAVEVSAVPTAVQLSLGQLPRQQVHTLRVRPAPIDLGAISQLDDLVRDVLDGRLDSAGALAALDRVETTSKPQPWPIAVAAPGGVGFALAPLLGGSWREAIAGGIVGVIVGAIALSARRAPALEPVLPPLAAIAASFAAAVFVAAGLGASPDLITLAALVSLLPGLKLTVGMSELAGKDLQSGVANTGDALVQLLGLVFGVEIGRSVAIAWLGTAAPVTLPPASTAVQVLAALLAGVAFTGTLHARVRDAPFICSATFLALAANAVGTDLFGHEAGIFGAALVVGIAGQAVSSRLRRSALIFIVPGVLMLVPGSIGYSSALQLLTNHAVSGITAAFEMFVTAVSIAYGLMIAAIVVPGRVTKARARRAAAAARRPAH
jgi:uncharacterized membrane protein YjjP (DUF1212 family)